MAKPRYDLTDLTLNNLTVLEWAMRDYRKTGANWCVELERKIEALSRKAYKAEYAACVARRAARKAARLKGVKS